MLRHKKKTRIDNRSSVQTVTVAGRDSWKEDLEDNLLSEEDEEKTNISDQWNALKGNIIIGQRDNLRA